jgi:uncharacterized radical SAM protein YgiQ
MDYDVIFVTGELFFDHPLCGVAILKRLLEKNGYSVAVIEMPETSEDVKKFGKPNLFFGITSGAIDSMIRNYTPLKKLRKEDEHLNYEESVPDRAVIVYSNWVKQHFKDSLIILGGTEATLRRFVHYDYWDNKLRRPILFDSRADLLVYGPGEKQILEICKKIKNNQSLTDIEGTCILAKELPKGFVELPNQEQVSKNKEKFCDMQNMLNNFTNLAQKIDNRYILQYKSPVYTSKDLDEYYEMPFTRTIYAKHLRGFEFSVVTHRGCIGDCNFCSLRITQGSKIISRSEDSIIREIRAITKLPTFRGNIDDLGGPSADMYGMDCAKCNQNCIDCKKLDRSNKRALELLRRVRNLNGVRNVFIRSGIRYDLATPEYLKEVAEYHTFDTLRIAPEHVNKKVLQLMNKNRSDLRKFLEQYKKMNARKKLSFYFITAHPGSGMNEAKELANVMKNLENCETVQVFTPTPMTVSTCMYYTSLDPKTKQKIYVPYTYSEKKEQKRILFNPNTKKNNIKEEPYDDDFYE